MGLRADGVPRWMLAVSHPMAWRRRSSVLGARSEASSMREQWGPRRRTIQRPRNWTKGSGQRTARLMMVW